MKSVDPTFPRRHPLPLTRRTFATTALAALASPLLSRRAGAQAAAGPPKLGTAGPQFTALSPAKVMPTLKLMHLNGRKADLAPRPGKVMLINFWATWCDACGKELSMLEDLQKTFGASLDIAAIAHDGGGEPIVGPYLQKQGIKHLDVYLDPDGTTTAEATRTGRGGPFVLYGTPTYYIISARGRIAGYIGGAVDWKSEAARALIGYFIQAE